MERINFTKMYAILLLSIASIVSLSLLVLAVEPQGPDSITITSSGRHTNNSAPFITDAQAGNVTALIISSVRTTETWQGYYGNVTGTITLDDANNQTLYDWSLPNPSGEIYASNYSIVTWNQIYCVNVSQTAANPVRPGGIVANTNGPQIELDYGINTTDRDGLNETFIDTYTDATGFRVGAITIDVNDGCSSAHPFTNQAYDSAGWQELLLSDNSSVIFTALLRESADGFQAGAEATDFQLLVLEDGHVGSETTTTPYYFFVELS